MNTFTAVLIAVAVAVVVITAYGVLRPSRRGLASTREEMHAEGLRRGGLDHIHKNQLDQGLPPGGGGS